MKTIKYHRPKTRGELYDNLKDGVICEVVDSNAEITNQLLESLSIIRKDVLEYTIVLSENNGWVLFKPNKLVG